MELKWRDMTREIIFKGKKVDNGEWTEGYLFDDGMLGEKRMFIGKLVIVPHVTSGTLKELILMKLTQTPSASIRD